MSDINVKDFMENISNKDMALYYAGTIVEDFSDANDNTVNQENLDNYRNIIKYVAKTLTKDEATAKQMTASIMPRLEKIAQIAPIKGAEFVRQEFEAIASNVGNVVDAYKHDTKAMEEMLNVAKTIQADNYDASRLSPNALQVYDHIVNQGVYQPEIYKQIVQEVATRTASDIAGAGEKSDIDIVRDMLHKVSAVTNGDEQCVEGIIKCTQKYAEEIPGANGDVKDDYNAEEYARGRYYDSIYQKEWGTILADLAASSVSNPKVVEKCLAEADKYRIDYRSIAYGKVAAAGYEANDFLNRYAKKLNDGSLLVHPDQPQVIEKMAEKLNVDVLRQAVVKAGNKIAYEEHQANKWHREAALTTQDYENRDALKELADARILETAVAEAKSHKNAPSIIYVEEYAGDRYGDWAERVYVKDSNGDYLKTAIVDDLYWGNERSSAREQIEDAGNLLAVAHGVYHRDDENSDFKLLESNEKYNYRVVSNEAYWRDPVSESMQFATRGAYEGSTLVTQNPINGKFEDVEFEVNYCNGDYLQGIKYEEEGPDKTIIYKRDAKDGHFYADAEFPATELMRMEQKNKNVIAMSFRADNGDYYNYMSDNRGSALAKKARHADKFEFVDRFSNKSHENKTHAQKPFANLKNMLMKKSKSSTR